MKKFSVLKVIGLLIGSVVGAGFLGIPYVVSKVGFPVGLLLITGVGLLILIQLLGLVEVTLRTAGKHQITGYVSKYLGEGWRNLVFVLVVLEGYGVLLAYIVAEGQVLSAIFGGSAFLLSYVFFALAAVVIFFGLRLIAKVDLLLTLAMSAVVIGLAFFSWSQIKFDNFLKFDLGELLPAYGVVLFSFLGAAAIPEMRIAITGQETKFARAVAIAGLIPIAIYIIFTAAVLGVTGAQTTAIATIGLGQYLGRGVVIAGNLLAAITMTTSFLGMSLALKETFHYDFHYKRVEAWLLTITVPLILFSLGLHNFIQILQFVGAVIGGLLGVVLVLTMWQAEKKGDRQPEFVLPYKKFFGWVLISVFVIGLLYTLKGIVY